MKKCYTCGEELSLEMFYKNRSRKDGVSHICKECELPFRTEYRKNHPEQLKLTQRRKTLKRYGITIEEYEEIFDEQEGKCAICGVEMVQGLGGNPLAACVDHDHETGRVRGILCSLHNRAIGLFGDDINLLKSAINYLEIGRNREE